MKTIVRNIANQIACIAVRTRTVLHNQKGESSISTAVSILTAVVLGGLILAGLYALLKNQVIPQLTQKILDMFNYAG